MSVAGAGLGGDFAEDAGRALRGLGPRAWHEHGRDVALGWLTWLGHTEKVRRGCVSF